METKRLKLLKDDESNNTRAPEAIYIYQDCCSFANKILSTFVTPVATPEHDRKKTLPASD